MIYCVWYPSGGFGHFVNAVLTLYAKEFERPKKTLKFSNDGNSHNLDLVTPKYFLEQWQGNYDFLDDKNYCVLIDNGITNESDKFKSAFPGAKVIKICYDDLSWPVVARTMIDKAMQSTIEQELPTDVWNTNEPWAKREKYFLFLRDHQLRHAWRPQNDNAIYINEFFDYHSFYKVLNSYVHVESFESTWNEWKIANKKYIEPIQIAHKIVSYILNDVSYDISNITDIWTQSVVFYYIWLRFNFEVAHNDYSNWFTNTDEIITMLTNCGVDIDSF